MADLATVRRPNRPNTPVLTDDGQDFLRERLISVWRYSTLNTPVPVIPFPDLAAFRSLRMRGWGLTCDAASAVNWFLRVSTTNGSTFANVNYENVGVVAGGGGGGGLVVTTQATGAVVGFDAWVENLNDPTLETELSCAGAVSNNAASKFQGTAQRTVAIAENALGLALGSGNWTGGVVKLYGRKGVS